MSDRIAECPTHNADRVHIFEHSLTERTLKRGFVYTFFGILAQRVEQFVTHFRIQACPVIMVNASQKIVSIHESMTLTPSRPEQRMAFQERGKY